MKRFQLPFGVQDYLPNECYNKTRIEAGLAKLFSLNGYDRVETPTLEYYDLFRDAVDPDSINKMFKMTDIDGSLLVLRPDTTVQICRMAATRLDLSHVNRLFYIENSFEYLPNTSTSRTREFSQAGVELLGKTGIEGDLEIVRLAIEGMLAAGLDDFLIEIGQVQFFKGLMKEYGLSREDAKALGGLINNKDMLGVELFLQKKNLQQDFISKFLMLPTLFGDISVLDKAEKLCQNPLCLEACDNLRKLVGKLTELKLDRYISIDLGMVQGVNYYSGVVIRGVSKNLGVSLLDGGRYDTLSESFHQQCDAVGFAIGIKRLLIALENRDKLVAAPPAHCAYIADGADAVFENEWASELRKSGKRVVKCFFETAAELKNYCKKTRIPRACAIKKSTVTDITLE